MANNAFKTAMPTSWRIAAIVGTIVGGVFGVVAVNRVRPDLGFDLVLSLIGGLVTGGVVGGCVVVLWFIYRALCPASDEDDADGGAGL